jgi:protein involved in polysaccharide export with SLBB domain
MAGRWRLFNLWMVLGVAHMLAGCASKPEPYVYEPPATSARAPISAIESTARQPERPAAGTSPRSGQPVEAERAAAPQRAALTGEAIDSGPASRSYRLRASDPVVVQLIGIPEPLQLELVVDDAGEISLPYLDPIRAEGQTLSELQRAVQQAYIDGGIYRRITVNVVIPTQSYFVRGEVRQPGRFPLTGGITVLQAIAAAGGYTEFANPRRINIIRDGETRIENARQMEQNPEEDMLVRAGDVIVVPRSIF